MFVNRMPRFEILSEDAIATLERGWRRLLSDVGIEFLHDEAVEMFRAAGQRVEGQIVRFDPDWVMAQVAQAPREFDIVGRNPARTMRLAPDHMNFVATQSTPFVREGTSRRDGNWDDYLRLVKLAHVVDEIDAPGYPVTEPSELPIDSRHMDMVLALYTHSDKPLGASSFNLEGTRDSLAMAEIAFGREALERSPVMWGIVNANSPLRFDTPMIGALLELARARQAVVVTPFILMGAMGPVSLPAALAQQTAESLAGLALVQLARPGCPMVMGSFASHTDMQSGSPGFGGPEAALGIIATGQIARRIGLPWRSGGGGLTSSQVPDAQAAAEALNTMLPAFLAGANLLLHTAGWLESGLVTCFEKWVIDIEILRVLQHEFTPLEIDEASLAFDSHVEAGHGGHFFGTQHTLEHFRDCFYRPLVFSTENFERWTRRGTMDTATRAAAKAQELIDSWEAPPIDAATVAELESYIVRRRVELGD